MDDISPGQWQGAVQALETALFQSAGFREESAGQPLVYGYARSCGQRPSVIAFCRRALERYCERERLRLCAVFADLGIGDEELTRPGLSGLCDVLRLPDSFAAVLVSVNQLSRNGEIAGRLGQQIRDTGARLLFVRPGADTTTAGASSVACGRLPEWWQ
jgi:DNA invertase Pin-like site-specific DNA recombinase